MEKIFTIEEANRALQLVAPIASDIVKKMREAQILHDEVKNVKMQSAKGETQMLEKLGRAEKLLNEVEYHMKELQSIGVLLKDLSRGFVDFPAMAADKIIYLCWMPGEKTIGFWHETDRGFEHRKSVSTQFKSLQRA